MIYRLRKKFIGICTLSLFTVFAVVISLVFLTTSVQTNQKLDRHADLISQNDGRFPDFGEIKTNGDKPTPPEGFNKESPFTTRYFTVKYDGEGNVLLTDIQRIASVTEQEAKNYAKEALNNGDERGWVENYRYKMYGTDDGRAIVFVNGENERESNRNFMLGVLSVFAICGLVIIVLIIFISKRAVKPAAESYEKQKQFVTNANHELKTPLTLIRTNLDILENEVGESEWITDIRDETMLMSELVNRLVFLARMDEDGSTLDSKTFCLSDAMAETASSFENHAESVGKNIKLEIKDNIILDGDEASVRQVISILLDNAVKYCDAGGEISVKLIEERRPTITVENSYLDVGNICLNRLFDRFYRADKARTHGTGFGIGLSIAKAIVEKHGGSISTYSIENKKIGFKVKL